MINIIDKLPKKCEWANRPRTNKIVIHHDAVVRPNSYNSLNRYITEANYHIKENGWCGITYHYKIDNVGDVYQCQPEGKWLYHCGNNTRNAESIAICLDGYFHPPQNQEPTNAQLQSLSDLLKDLLKRYSIGTSQIYGHRDIVSTACPGDNLYKYKPWIRESPAQGDSMKTRTIFLAGKDAQLVHIAPEDVPLFTPENGKLYSIIRGCYMNYDNQEVVCTIADPKFLQTAGVSPDGLLPSIGVLNDKIQTITSQRDTLSNQLELSGQAIDGKEEELTQLTKEYTQEQQGWLIKEENYQVEIGKLIKKIDSCKCVDDPVRDWFDNIIDWVKGWFK